MTEEEKRERQLNYQREYYQNNTKKRAPTKEPMTEEEKRLRPLKYHREYYEKNKQNIKENYEKLNKHKREV